MSQSGSFAEHFLVPLSSPPTTRRSKPLIGLSSTSIQAATSRNITGYTRICTPSHSLSRCIPGLRTFVCLVSGTTNQESFNSRLQILAGHPSAIPGDTSSPHRTSRSTPSTLRANTRLGEMIMAINVSCHVMPQYIVMFDEAFRRILGMSPNATRLSQSMDVRDLLICSTRQYNLSKLVHLDLQVGNERLADVLLCLPQGKSLTILSLSFNTYDEDYRDVTYLALEHLQEFQITVMWSPRQKLDFFDTITRKWKLPSLCRFTMYEWRPHISQYLNFLDVHGERLTTLSITAPLHY
ncbi:hypothetical protein BDR07DRAFT_660561 [Suillus spraguei]|nr:hypothetical protein BDR07DRAFT_660561 [Suillus spraguei]